MHALIKKLFRNIRHGKGQFIAVTAVVTVGIMVYISMSSSYYNLKKSQEDFYKRANFADHYFVVVKAPEQVVKDIESLSGVRRATGRISYDLSILKKDNTRASARIVTYSLPMDNELNRVLLKEGRLFAGRAAGSGLEATANPGFVEANNINWGDSITVIYKSRPISLTIVGTADSPEFIYPIKDLTSILPDYKSFGIFMVPQYEAQQIFNMQGQINQLLVEFMPDVNKEKVVKQIKEQLKPYGLLTSYPRKDQLSHALLQGELDQLKSLITYLPLIFLSIAAAIEFIILRRMIKNQRGQIGILKALGYSNRQIIFHYSGYALLVGLIGAILGTVLGLLLSGVITQTYQQYFNLPAGLAAYNKQSIVYGFLISIVVGLLAGWSASRQVSQIQPAESMRPQPPNKVSSSILEKCPYIWKKLSSNWKISLRNISRNRGRFLLTTIGIMFAVGLLVISYFMNDAVDYMMKEFFRDQKYDLLIRTEVPIRDSELTTIYSIDGVLKVEPFLELPVRINYKGKSEEDIFSGYLTNSSLKIITDEKGNKLRIPEEGILLSHIVAKKLGVKVGESVEVETLLPNGPTHTDIIKVVGISHQMIGSSTYINIETANSLIGEKGLISGAMLKTEVGKAAAVEKELNKMLNISSIGSLAKELENFQASLDAVIYAVSIMVLFAVILGFAIVYNASLMTFNERERELASLKVLGYSTKELASLLSKESLLQAILGIILGLPFGRFMVQGYINSLETDLYSFPVIIYPLTYVFSAITAVVFIVVAHHLAIRGVNYINLVEVLKNRD